MLGWHLESVVELTFGVGERRPGLVHDGFWTGLNYVAAASGQSPAKINMSAIVVEVEKSMRSAHIANISQRRMDDVSWVYEVAIARP